MAEKQNGASSGMQRRPVRGSVRSALSVGVGRTVRAAARLRGGGSALPGMVVEKIDPNFLARTLGQLPLGVIVVSGTNGKTTTTRMIAKTLENCGLKVFTNPTGSNFVRGVVSALVSAVSPSGKLDADIAVLELDEAYAVHFVKRVRPRYCLLLNVMRDQLDRFGEIDNTAHLLASVAAATTGTAVLNREDSRIAALARVVPASARAVYYGLEPALRPLFPSDDELHDDAGAGRASEGDCAGSSDNSNQPNRTLPAAVTLAAARAGAATFLIDGQEHSTPMRVAGVYNLFNAAAALALARVVLKDACAAGYFGGKMVADSAIVSAISTVTSAFGRGESIDMNGTPIELVLVKNPAGFRLALRSFDPAGVKTMIAINDEYADGRDMSWLWDVDFASLRAGGVAMVSGVRCWDMAVRLDYDQVAHRRVDASLTRAVKEFVSTDPRTPKRIYCTYTAMLAIRKELGTLTDVPDAGVGA